VARELGCNYVLDGSVRRSGARVRVSAQLIECESETTLWSDRFDRDLSDVFALQDEIAAAIARALQVSFSPSAGATGIDQVAYELYLRAKASVSNWLGARDGALLEQTVARAPRFSQAWAALAVTRATEASLERTAERIAPLRTRAIEAAEAALSLDPQNGAAHIALGIVEPICGRFRERDELAAKALQLAPNDPLVLFWAFRWSRSVGRLRRSLECISRAFELDPLWPQAVHQYASALATDGQDDEASRIWDQALERWPYVGYLVPAQVQMAALIGDWPRVDALRIAIEAKGVPENRYLVRALRDAENARHWGAELTERLRRRLCQELEASGTLRLGQPFACQVGLADTVYALFERARFEHLFEPHGRLPDGEWDTWVLFMRGGDAMRRDARFVRLCARLGMCDYWAETDRWPDCAADLAPYYDFRAEARRQVS
jgi:tetratricopeptide (TPR) repeat protein